MAGIYQFTIEGYGIYISQSINPSGSLISQCKILSAGTHHHLVLQKLWNIHYDLISYSIVKTVPQSILQLAAQIYRKQFPFTLDSVYRSSIISHRFISRRYTGTQRTLCLEVDHNQLVHIYDEQMKKIGIEIGVPGLQSGYYKTNTKNAMKRVSYGIS